MDRTNIIEAGKFLTAVLTNKNVAAQAVFADAHRLGTQRPWESEQPHNVTPVAQDAIAAIAEKALRVGFDTALSLFQWKDVASVEDLLKDAGDRKYLVTDGSGVCWGSTLGPEQLDGYHAKIAAYIPYPIPNYEKEQNND